MAAPMAEGIRNSELENSMKSCKTRILIAALAIVSVIVQSSLSAEDRKIRVVTTTADLAYLAREVGRDLVQVENLLPATADPHFADARPDFIVKLNRADILALIGLDLEVGWLPPIIQQSRNPKIFVGAEGYCDASVGIHVLEKPTGRVDRSMGDIHIFGNPHYWMDPLNAAIMARNLRDAMIRVDPDRRSEYEKNYNALFDRLRTFTKEQMNRFAPAKGTKVAVYHKEFSYLAHRFGFDASVSIEEKPGVPPSAAYLKKVVEDMNRENIRLILIAPYNNPRYANSVAEKTGAKVLVMPTTVGSMEGIDTYEASISRMLDLILQNR
jgi:zinc/manganese transport system substrate-binding protein